MAQIELGDTVTYAGADALVRNVVPGDGGIPVYVVQQAGDVASYAWARADEVELKRKAGAPDNLESMKKDELVELAAQSGIALPPDAKKADIVQTLATTATSTPAPATPQTAQGVTAPVTTLVTTLASQPASTSSNPSSNPSSAPDESSKG